jgi:hypothetical protein
MGKRLILILITLFFVYFNFLLASDFISINTLKRQSSKIAPLLTKPPITPQDSLIKKNNPFIFPLQSNISNFFVSDLFSSVNAPFRLDLKMMDSLSYSSCPLCAFALHNLVFPDKLTTDQKEQYADLSNCSVNGGSINPNVDSSSLLVDPSCNNGYNESSSYNESGNEDAIGSESSGGYQGGYQDVIMGYGMGYFDGYGEGISRASSTVITPSTRITPTTPSDPSDPSTPAVAFVATPEPSTYLIMGGMLALIIMVQKRSVRVNR